MIFWVSRPTRSLVRLANVLTMLCLTASLSAAAESQPRWVTNEVEWFGEVAPCFGFSVSETARRWRRLQAAAESSTLAGPDLRRLFAALAFLTQHAQSTPADAATALQIFETVFILGHFTVAYLSPADNSHGSLLGRLKGAHQPVIKSRNRCSASCSSLLAGW